MSSVVKNVLREARALVENGWCQGRSKSVGFPIGGYTRSYEYSQVHHGRVRYVAPENAAKECYSLTGALHAVSNLDRTTELRAQRELLQVLPPEDVGKFVALSSWNDRSKRTHAEVLELLDRAIGEKA